MRNVSLRTCGVSIAAIALGLSLAATPASAAGWRHGGGWHGGWHGGGWHGGWRHGYGGYGGYGWGAGLGLGLLGGAIVASQYPYGGGYYGYGDGYGYGYGNGYGDGYAPAPGYGAYPEVAQGGDNTAYCESRFKSYDPESGTYLGYDGLRHPCP